VTGVPPPTVYAHPTCSKSRAATEILTSRGVVFETVDYLETPPDAATVGRLLDMLDGPPAALVRADDARFGELGLTSADIAGRPGVIAVLVAHPELLQRPVVVVGHRAVVARPPELLLTLFD